eukprot:scaffold2435_cov121-Cylindrotheca_fusiformis.AAC.5
MDKISSFKVRPGIAKKLSTFFRPSIELRLETNSMRMSATMISGSLITLFLLSAVNADKDISYYDANHGNPNVDLPMYWKDAENVLDDLSQFSSLHIQFHQCVWSYSYDEEGQEEAEDGSDTWYIGSVPRMGANVAFSLYGSLAGNKFKGCSADTFINSFYTNTGLSDFTSAMQYAGISFGDDEISDTCENYQGIGCDTDYGFALHTYSSGTCNPEYFSAVADTMSSMNEGMDSIQCTEIYNAKSYYDDDSYSSALSILEYSSACNYMNYWSPDGNCPDPYGRIKTYIKNFNNGIQNAHQNPYETYNRAVKKAKVMTIGGAIGFILAGMALGFFAGIKTPKQRKMIKKMRRAMSNVGRPGDKRPPPKPKPSPSVRSDEVATVQRPAKVAPAQRPAEVAATQVPALPAAPSAPISPDSPKSTIPIAGSMESQRSKASLKRFGVKMMSSFGKNKTGEESVVDLDKFQDEISNDTSGTSENPIVIAQTASHSSAEDV